MTMDYSPWSEGEIWPFLRVAISPKPKGSCPPKMVYMHVTSTPIYMNFLSQFRSIKFFDDHGLPYSAKFSRAVNFADFANSNSIAKIIFVKITVFDLLRPKLILTCVVNKKKHAQLMLRWLFLGLF